MAAQKFDTGVRTRHSVDARTARCRIDGDDDANAADDAVVFQTVAPTPKPRVIDMKLESSGPATLTRLGSKVAATRLTLLPTINFLIDPILQRMVPKTEFFVDDGKPPLLIRFAGPRNYAGQSIRLE
jgi:hypothetical protein